MRMIARGKRVQKMMRRFGDIARTVLQDAWAKKKTTALKAVRQKDRGLVSKTRTPESFDLKGNQSIHFAPSGDKRSFVVEDYREAVTAADERHKPRIAEKVSRPVGTLGEGDRPGLGRVRRRT